MNKTDLFKTIEKSIQLAKESNFCEANTITVTINGNFDTVSEGLTHVAKLQESDKAILFAEVNTDLKIRLIVL